LKVILFDLGKTLEFNGELLPGAEEVLSSIKMLNVGAGNSHAIGLVSDFDNFSQGLRLIDVKPLQVEYYSMLENLGIRPFFEPLYRYVTLSTEVGVKKPDKKIFRAAVDLIEKDLSFESVLFITEDPSHVTEARQLGMKAIHFKGPGQGTGDVEQLKDLIPLIKAFLGAS
jgi:beta-phosphoglucomutase-like phosphatase (HAD superfamily)